MLHKMFAVRDAKAELFSKPILAVTPGEAERAFAESINRPDTIHNNHPQDFDLYQLGEYDDNTGKMFPLPTPLHMVKGIELVRRKQDVNPLSSVQN